VEWLIRLWEQLIRDVVLTVGGVIVVGTQVIAAHPNPTLIAAGVALTAPSAYANLRKAGGGSPGPPSPPPGPEPITPPSGSADG
jgi:hypothetical protein